MVSKGGSWEGPDFVQITKLMEAELIVTLLLREYLKLPVSK